MLDKANAKIKQEQQQQQQQHAQQQDPLLLKVKQETESNPQSWSVIKTEAEIKKKPRFGKKDSLDRGSLAI